jgi:glycosyltransferase involved in cell wall biosynthesis
MRIVFLASIGKVGGAERCLLNIMAGLRSAQPEWELFLVSGSAGPLLSLAAELGVQTETLVFPQRLAKLGVSEVQSAPQKRVRRLIVLLARCVGVGFPVCLYRRKLSKLLASLNPDVVHTNGFKMHVLAVWSRPQRAALVWHFHDYLSPRPFIAAVLRLCAPKCSMSIANSLSVADDLSKAGAERFRVCTILNAIDVAQYSPDGNHLDLDKLSGMPHAPAGTVRIGLVATMARWKGHEVFLRALASLPDPLRVRGYIVGGPVYDTSGSQHSIGDLRRTAERVGARNVGFTGYLADTAGAMRSLDIVVHASTNPEPFGLVIAEAMACGRPVIYSEAGGAMEVGSHGVSALCHRPGDVKGLAACMLKLINDPVLRATLGAAGRERAVQHFDRNRLAGQFVPLYREVSGLSTCMDEVC